jgi:hypothetical protein
VQANDTEKTDGASTSVTQEPDGETLIAQPGYGTGVVVSTTDGDHTEPLPGSLVVNFNVMAETAAAAKSIIQAIADLKQTTIDGDTGIKEYMHNVQSNIQDVVGAKTWALSEQDRGGFRAVFREVLGVTDESTETILEAIQSLRRNVREELGDLHRSVRAIRHEVEEIEHTVNRLTAPNGATTPFSAELAHVLPEDRPAVDKLLAGKVLSATEIAQVRTEITRAEAYGEREFATTLYGLLLRQQITT